MDDWAQSAANPPPSWSDGAAKQGIILTRVTKGSGPDLVPPAERIATVDNDGTLRAEQRLDFQAFFTMDRVKVLAPQHPEWKQEEPFAGANSDYLEQ